MGILEVAMLAMMGHMVVLGIALGTQILEFADGLNLVICNTLFCEAGSQVGNICKKYS